MLVTPRKLLGVLSILAGSGLLAHWLLAMSTHGFVSTLLFGLPGLPLIGGLWLFGGVLAGVGDWPGKTAIVARRAALQAVGVPRFHHHL